MVDVSKIQDSLINLIGYNQPFNPKYAIVDADNLLSESGYFVTSNPFAKIDYIKDCQDYKDISDGDFNIVLADIKRGAISDIVNQVFNSYSYIDRNFLYKSALNKIDTDVLPNGFVGYKITVDDVKNIAFSVTRVFLDFDKTGDIEILLFNSSKKEVIQSKVVTVTSDHQEVILDWKLDDTDELYKGEYYIGYINNESFVLEPYKRDYENSNVMSIITHLLIDKVKVPSHNSNELFDLNKVEFINESIGINLDITVYEDFTDLVIQNKFLFARAIYLKAVISCLSLYISSNRSSGNQRHSNELYNKILIEIDGTRGEDNVISVKGLRSQMLTEISDIKTQIESLREGYKPQGIMLMTEM